MIIPNIFVVISILVSNSNVIALSDANRMQRDVVKKADSLAKASKSDSAFPTPSSSLKIPLRTIRLQPQTSFGKVPRLSLWEERAQAYIKSETMGNDAMLSPINTTFGFGDCLFPPCKVRVGTIEIGTPPQSFDMIMSFESSNFWVYDSRGMIEKICSKEGIKKNQYNSNASRTAITTKERIDFSQYQIIDGDGRLIKATGSIAYDTAGVDNIHVPNVTFGAINEVNSNLCESLFKKPADGEMGLMLVNETGEEITKIPSPMFGFIANAEKPLITIYQKPSTFGWNEEILDGSLTIGSENVEDCSSFTHAISYNVTTSSADLQGQPRIRINSVQLSDGFNAAIEPREAAIVEGMGIQLSVEEADRIGQHLAEFGTRRIQPGLFSVPCDMRGKLPTLQLEIGGKNGPVNLDFNEYILNYRKKLCFLGVFLNFYSIEQNATIIIGNGMLQGKCMTLNVIDQTVSFGNAII